MHKKISISTSENGPLVLKNLATLTEANGNIFPVEKIAIALCRCGNSQYKPFCDGTHGKVGWTDEKLEGRQPGKIDSYKGKNIIIHDNRGICAHVGYCTDGLPKVFQMGVEPWINADAETLEKIIETIKKCPSGALSYSIDGILYNNYSEHPENKITQNEQLRELFDEEKAITQFKNFYTATNNELKVFARTNGVNDVHKLNVSDVVTDNKVVSDFTDIEHV